MLSSCPLSHIVVKFIWEEVIIMRLNPDCIKDILLYLENNEQLIISPNDIIKRVEHNVPELQQYSFDEPIYHSKQCDLSNFITNFKTYIHGGINISCLTPKAHEFLKYIRTDTTWNKIKDRLKKLAVPTMTALIEIAIKTATQ